MVIQIFENVVMARYIQNFEAVSRILPVYLVLPNYEDQLIFFIKKKNLKLF